MSPPAYLSLRDVAAMTSLSVDAIRAAVRRGELPAVKLCHRIRIAQADVDAWLVRSSVVVDPEERPIIPPAIRKPISRRRGSLRRLMQATSEESA